MIKTREKQNLSKRKLFTSQKGITLVALVVTIVILLILAGISIELVLGDNGIVSKTKDAKFRAQIEEEKSAIELAVVGIETEQLAESDKVDIKKDELKETLNNNIKDKNIIVSDKRPNEEYQYIVNIDGNEYGIKQNNEVEVLNLGIRNAYIEIREVTEPNPKFKFDNVVKQKEVDKEVNGENADYQIIGISDSEDGEFITTGQIEGKSGVLEVIDLQNATFEYTLNNFMLGDEVFYLKIQIGDISKIQKLTVVQGDEVRYEENFAGITYTGEWTTIEDENFSGGTAKISTSFGNSLDFNFIGSFMDISSLSKSDSGTFMAVLYKIGDDGAESVTNLAMIVFYNDGSKEDDYIRASEFKGEKISARPEIKDRKKYSIRHVQTNSSEKSSTAYFDAIWIYK